MEEKIGIVLSSVFTSSQLDLILCNKKCVNWTCDEISTAFAIRCSTWIINTAEVRITVKYGTRTSNPCNEFYANCWTYHDIHWKVGCIAFDEVKVKGKILFCICKKLQCKWLWVVDLLEGGNNQYIPGVLWKIIGAITLFFIRF
jgi:hypothetical protein